MQLFWGVQVSMYCSWNFAWLTIAPSTYRGEESVAVACGAHALVKFKFQEWIESVMDGAFGNTRHPPRPLSPNKRMARTETLGQRH